MTVLDVCKTKVSVFATALGRADKLKIFYMHDLQVPRKFKGYLRCVFFLHVLCTFVTHKGDSIQYN